MTTAALVVAGLLVGVISHAFIHGRGYDLGHRHGAEDAFERGRQAGVLQGIDAERRRAADEDARRAVRRFAADAAQRWN